MNNRFKHAIENLKNYKGNNPKILQIKLKISIKGESSLTQNDVDLLLNNKYENYREINKVISITEYIGKSYQEKYNFNFLPERIYVGHILNETEKAYLVTVKFTKKQEEYIELFLPKSQINTNLFDTKINKIKIKFDELEKLNKLGRKYYEHQKEGIQFLLERDKCVLADDMGLGKTSTTISAAIASGSEKILVVCPSNAKINWYREISYFEDEENISIIEGNKWITNKFTIINYDILKNFYKIVDGRKKENKDIFMGELYYEDFDLIIIDEAHMIKNPSSIRGKIISKLIKNIPKRWLLTGTPMANRPLDYYMILNICGSQIAQNWKTYTKKYCDAREIVRKDKNGRVKSKFYMTSGSSNLEELRERTKELVLRRKKEDVLDLPEKIITPYYLELDNIVEYNSVFNEYLDWCKLIGKNLGAGRHMVELIVLRKFIAKEKVTHTYELVKDIIENDDKKVIIFTCFTHSLKELKELFGDVAVCHSGDMNSNEKQVSVDRFQSDDKIKVFIGNIKSAGTAITLTEGQVVVFNDLDFVPANHAQAEDRSYRIGQKNMVNCYYPIFQDSVEEKIYNILNEKKKIISTVIGDKHEEINIIDDFVKTLFN
jgi:SWI/SNF-related matrix-associated actin-dependent regulator 1 of chromatin subfamily A